MGIDIEKLDNKTIRELQNYVRLQKNSIIHDKEESGLDSQENNYSFCWKATWFLFITIYQSFMGSKFELGRIQVKGDLCLEDDLLAWTADQKG